MTRMTQLVEKKLTNPHKPVETEAEWSLGNTLTVISFFTVAEKTDSL